MSIILRTEGIRHVSRRIHNRRSALGNIVELAELAFVNIILEVDMAKMVIHKGIKITHFECKDCGKVHGKKTLRPNNKFCDPVCMDYVLSLANVVEDLPNKPGDEVAALKMRIVALEKKLDKHMKLHIEAAKEFKGGVDTMNKARGDLNNTGN